MTVTVSEGLRGNEGLYLSVTVGAGPAKDLSADLKTFQIDPDNPDDSDLTFLEATTGGAQVDSVTIKAIQSTAASSFWRWCWDNPGVEVAVVYGPHGNAVADADKPHFLMTCKTGLRPLIGGDAKRDKTRQEFETTWEVTDGPTLDDGA